MDVFHFDCMIELFASAKLKNCLDLVFDLLLIEENPDYFYMVNNSKN